MVCVGGGRVNVDKVEGDGGTVALGVPATPGAADPGDRRLVELAMIGT